MRIPLPTREGSFGEKIIHERKVFKMKKILFMTMIMVFALTLGLAYAGDEARKVLSNGVTDFTGRSYDTLGLGPAGEIAHADVSAAGGLRAGKAIEKLHNGVTDFTGRSFDALELGQDREIASAESSAAGGLRAGEAMKELSNGVSDFSGRSYDML